MKYVRFIFEGKVLNYERHVGFFQFLIYRKIIESSLEDLNYTRVTKLTQEEEENWMDEKLLFLSIVKVFFVHHPNSKCRRILGLNCLA